MAQNKKASKKVNKWTVVNIILAVLLVISVGFNIFFALKLPGEIETKETVRAVPEEVDPGAKIYPDNHSRSKKHWHKNTQKQDSTKKDTNSGN